MVCRYFALCIAIFFTALLIDGIVARREDQDKSNKIRIGGRWFSREKKIGRSAEASQPLFEQCLDHFSPDGCETKWHQRYWVNSSDYRPGGAAILAFGGEDPADDEFADLYVYEKLALKHRAYRIVLEHRFYGDSWPVANDSVEVKQKLFTSRQALADAAYFIKNFTAYHNLHNTSWIAVGGSYPGNLAAWMRQKYPNLVKTAYASSAPVELKLYWSGHVEVVSLAIKETHPKCADRLYAVFQCLEKIVYNGEECYGYSNASEVNSALRICPGTDLAYDNNNENFFTKIVFKTWMDPSESVKTCEILESITGTNPIDMYANFLEKMNLTGGNCSSAQGRTVKTNREEILEFLKSNEGRTSAGASWSWQVCNEFGYVTRCDPKYGLFGNNTFIGVGTENCGQYGEETYGKTEYLQSRVAEGNAYYKGKNYDGTCVVFTNGGLDVWSSLGFRCQSETSINNTVIFFPKYRHCEDLYETNITEYMKLQDQALAQIETYLNDPNC